MEITAALITAVMGVLVSLVASLLTKFFSDKTLVRKSKIKIGGVEIQLSESADESTRKILDRVQELQKSPQVFLSYSVRDKEFAQRLAADLREQDVKVWLADEQVKVGDKITDTIREGISSSQWVIIILSENSTKSNFIEKELSFALTEEEKRNRPFVLPVLISDINLPSQLLDKQYADFRNDYLSGLQKLLNRLKPPRESLKRQSLAAYQSENRSESSPLLLAMERGEISQSRFIEAQQWASWHKWINEKQQVGYFELLEHKAHGELVPAIRIAIQEELEKLYKKQVESKLLDNESDMVQRLSELIKKETG